MVQQNKYKIITCILIFTFTFLFFHCGSQSSSPLKIKSSKRAHKLLIGDRTRYHELTPVNPATHVILDLYIDGISTDDFSNANRDSVYVMAAGQICGPQITQSGIVNGKKTIRLCLAVPREASELTLQIGSFPPKTFTVKGKIYDELKDW